MNYKRGQIWIETVIYTLIGLAIIGSLLYVVVPRINQMTDEAIVAQSIESLKVIDEKIYSVSLYPGASRELDLSIRKGSFSINPINETISYTLDETKYKYSEVNEILYDKNFVQLTSEDKGRTYKIYLAFKYDNLNLSFNSKDDVKKLNSASGFYTLLFENTGKLNNITQINIRLIS